jgi:hypothetical protein
MNKGESAGCERGKRLGANTPPYSTSPLSQVRGVRASRSHHIHPRAHVVSAMPTQSTHHGCDRKRARKRPLCARKRHWLTWSSDWRCGRRLLGRYDNGRAHSQGLHCKRRLRTWFGARCRGVCASDATIRVVYHRGLSRRRCRVHLGYGNWTGWRP